MVPETQTSPLSLWRNRDYLLLWNGLAISTIGSAAASIAFPLLVLGLTNSPVQAGIVGALQRAPFLVLGLITGAMIDRWNRKRVMIICDACRTVAFASIPLAAATDRLSMPLIYFVALVEGIGFAFFNVAEVAALPRVIHESQLPRAAAQNNLIAALSSLLGPPLGGVLYGVRRSLPFLVDAASYALSVVSLLFIRKRFESERPVSTGSIWADVKEGIVWLWGQQLMRFLAFLTGANALVGSSLPLAVIVLSRTELHAGPAAIGIIIGLAALGGVLGALLTPSLLRRATLGSVLLGGLWLDAILTPLLAIGSNLAVLAVIAAGLFFASPIYDASQFSYRMARIPDTLQGRVNSVYRIIITAGQPAGQVLTGLLLQLLSPRPTIALLGVGAVLNAVVATLKPAVRHARL